MSSSPDLRDTVVFTGPSLAAAAVASRLPEASVRPPARRGDLAGACAEGARTVLLIDGAFAHAHAVSPGEVVSILRAGVRVIGAASLGALRAAECGVAGMEGVGAVHRLLCLGVLAGDDEVAVAVEPDAGHRAASDALVTIRFAVLAGLRAARLDPHAARRVLAAARAAHFSERRWPLLLAEAGVEADATLLGLVRACDPKRRDAARAVAKLAAEEPPARARRPGALAPGPGPGPGPGPAPARRPGHDPLLGMAEPEARDALHRWLRASGRHRRYWKDPPHDPDATWSALARWAELEGELLRLHAVRTGAALATVAEGRPPAPWLAAARAEVASAHGFASWRALERAGGPPGVPLCDVRRATTALALARRNLGTLSAAPYTSD